MQDETGAHPVELTAREWTLLQALATRAGRIVAKSDLEGLILGLDSEVSSNVVEVHIANLRRKLDLPESPAPIDTIRGVGYQLANTR